MKNINIVLKGLPDSKFGYLKLSVRQNRKTIIQSLDIKVLKKDFNVKTQRIRSSAKEKDLDNRTFQEINDFLDQKIIEYSNNPFSISKIKCLGQFIKIVINETENIGTKEKYENILRLFQHFIKEEYNKDDLEFEKIDSSVIISFYQYLRKDKIINKRKAKYNTRNTANYKIKTFKAFFSKLQDRGIYKYYIDPFKPLKLKFDDTKKDFLTLEEFNKFVLFNPKEFRSNTLRAPIQYNLEDIQESFIFSCLSQGLRISDIITLRVNDFVVEQLNSDLGRDYTLYIHKKMFKTKKNVVIYLNNISTKYIERQVFRLVNDYLPEYKEEKIFPYYIKDIKERNEAHAESHKFFIQSLIDASVGTNQYKELRKKLDFKIEMLNNRVHNNTISIIKELNNNVKTKTLFIFPFLNNNNFKNINENNDFSSINKNQYLEFVGKRSYINNLLKKIFIQAQINKDYLSFHSARHTYTTLILENNDVPINLYDLQQSLGHHSILSTEKYIRNFNVSKLKNINNGIISRLKLYDDE